LDRLTCQTRKDCFYNYWEETCINGTVGESSPAELKLKGFTQNCGLISTEFECGSNPFCMWFNDKCNKGGWKLKAENEACTALDRLTCQTRRDCFYNYWEDSCINGTAGENTPASLVKSLIETGLNYLNKKN